MAIFNHPTVIIIGDAGVGKTSLVMRYAHHIFESDYKATIGVDFEVEKFEIMGVPFTLQMWDTAGSERFQCIASSYYRGANAVMICFDYSKIQSLHTARKWLDNAIAENPTQEVFLIQSSLPNWFTTP
jgi:Ras-related protein Rab-34